MKHVYAPAVLLVLALTGCAGLTNSKFDPIEYSRYVDIATTSRLNISRCVDQSGPAATSKSIASQADYAVGYSVSKIQNERVAAAGKELQALTRELADRYSAQAPSVGYCQLKLAQIATAAETIAKSIGKKED